MLYMQTAKMTMCKMTIRLVKYKGSLICTSHRSWMSFTINRPQNKILLYIFGNVIICLFCNQLHKFNIGCCCDSVGVLQTQFLFLLGFSCKSFFSFLTLICRWNVTAIFQVLFVFCVVLSFLNFFAQNIEQFGEYKLSIIQFAFCLHNHNAHQSESLFFTVFN